MPRGTIHMAVAGPDQLSAHLTISTYQRWTRLDLVHHLIGILLNRPVFQITSPLDSKTSLPQGALFQTRAALADIASGMSATLLALESSTDQLPIPEALDSMGEDFMRSRLPPHPAQLRARGPSPDNKDDLIEPRLRRCCRLFPGPTQGVSLRAFTESGRCGVTVHQGEGTSYFLLTCLENSREDHMLQRNDVCEGSESEDGDGVDNVGSEDIEEDDDGDGDDRGVMVFPASCSEALEKALQLEAYREKDAAVRPIRIDDLPMPGSSEVRIQFARALWELGVVSITPSSQTGKTARKAGNNQDTVALKKSRRKL